MTIKELRKMTGWTQTQFAEYFGLSSYRAVQNWESAKTKIVNGKEVELKNSRECATWILELMIYKLQKEGVIEIPEK